MAAHGDRRNYRRVTESTPVHFQTIDTGQPIVAHNARSFTGEDHWCEICGEWVEPRGILSAILCPQCDAPWDKRYWETPTAPRARDAARLLEQAEVQKGTQ